MQCTLKPIIQYYCCKCCLNLFFQNNKPRENTRIILYYIVKLCIISYDFRFWTGKWMYWFYKPDFFILRRSGHFAVRVSIKLLICDIIICDSRAIVVDYTYASWLKTNGVMQVQRVYNIIGFICDAITSYIYYSVLNIENV